MIFEVLDVALDMMKHGPKSLQIALDASARVTLEVSDYDSTLIRQHLATAPPGDITASRFRRALQGWDYEGNEPWTSGTARNTDKRRAIIYESLKIDSDFIAICERLFPHQPLDPPVVIATEHKRWYTRDIRAASNFYWTAYSRQLLAKGWSDESIRQLDASTTSVVERLSDPTADTAFQSKGLVVGYVQSGKTANFTGVIAKAADAGYKLVIVLAGTLDVLRSQTQRRIDKDMIGQELLNGLLDKQYLNDSDWDDFVKHGAKPSQLGSFDWYRLTGPESDYQELGRSVEALQFERADRTKPLWERGNLFSARTRIAVIKKNSKILRRLLDDLALLRSNEMGAPLVQVPTLIIDDESDQASINVKKNEAADDVKERTAINGSIVDLLKLLPRAQYVGYTATPFANVFIDPDIEEDLFPKDYLISLPRPVDYMGVSDFYDLDGGEEADSKPNFVDYVRPVCGDDDKPENLIKAIDSFVLSGALKLYRHARNSLLRFRHHTMLVHSSTQVIEHRELRKSLTDAFSHAGYEGGAGVKRLETLLKDDFRLVSGRRGTGQDFPADFGELEPFIGECLSRIGNPATAAHIVNNEKNNVPPDFDGKDIWKFIVGGTKLSRGYTVEGLTVSYYRRRAATSDTLMQMGRWFGFRKGYRDLVRLFIGTEEKIDRRGHIINLYDAFGAVCRDEEDFREELRRYERMDPRILPRDIPPLVSSRMLRPTARNKMFNARITYRNFGGRLSESTFAPTEVDRIKRNHNAIEALLRKASVKSVEVSAVLKSGSRKILTANVARLDPEDVVKLLQGYAWYDRRYEEANKGGPMLDQIDFLTRSGDRDPGIRDWLLFAPQLSGARAEELIAGTKYCVVYRSRRGDGKDRFVSFSDPKHREFAEHIAEHDDKELEDPNAALQALRQPNRAVMMLYLITDVEDAKPPFTPGFTLLFPRNEIKSPITFGVVRSDRPDAPVITAD